MKYAPPFISPTDRRIVLMNRMLYNKFAKLVIEFLVSFFVGFIKLIKSDVSLIVCQSAGVPNSAFLECIHIIDEAVSPPA